LGWLADRTNRVAEVSDRGEVLTSLGLVDRSHVAAAAPLYRASQGGANLLWVGLPIAPFDEDVKQKSADLLWVG
jgi:hypothetical protein